MKTFIKSAILAIILAADCTAAFGADITPSKKYVTRKVTSKPFDAVRTNTAIDIIYTDGPQDITIYAPDNLLPYIQVTLKGSEIIVNYKEDMRIRGSHKTHVKISAPDVVRFTCGSAGDITIGSDLIRKGKKVELTALSAGDINARNIEAEHIALRSNSAGDIETGSLKADYVTVTANSAGDIETGNITAKVDADIIANSAGEIDIPELYAGGKIKIAANSAGDIEIKEASASDIHVSATSSGDIEIKSSKSTNVMASCSSAGDIEISGICADASFSTGSSGSIKAKKLKATDVTATVRSVGDIECYALKSLTAERQGNGYIRYVGKPSELLITGRNGGVTQL